MLAHLRACLRSLLALVWTLGIYALQLLCRVALFPWPGWANRTHAAVMSLWGRGLTWLIGGRVRVQGTPPAPPFFLVSNHLSYLDIPVLYAHLAANFLAKSEVASWPLIGWLSRTTGTMFIDRGRKSDLTRAIAEVEACLRAGKGVVVFPEGTSTKGEQVLPFKPSLFEIAVRTACPVSYASLSYSTPPGAAPAELSLCWWGDMPFLSHLYQLLSLPSFQAVLTFGGQPLVGDDRKHLAARAHEAVSQSFIPVVGGRAT